MSLHGQQNHGKLYYHDDYSDVVVRSADHRGGAQYLDPQLVNGRTVPAARHAVPTAHQFPGALATLRQMRPSSVTTGSRLTGNRSRRTDGASPSENDGP